LGVFAISVATYSACWTYSTNNCVYPGYTRYYNDGCQTTIITANDYGQASDYAVTPSTPGPGYHDREWSSDGCWTTWDYIDCNYVYHYGLWYHSMGYYKVKETGNCVQP
jgi:hypothetical protein